MESRGAAQNSSWSKLEIGNWNIESHFCEVATGRIMQQVIIVLEAKSEHKNIKASIIVLTLFTVSNFSPRPCIEDQCK